MIHLTRKIKQKIKECVKSKKIKIGRLKRVYYNFCEGCVIAIDMDRKWFYIFSGASTMSGPVNKEIKWQ